MQDEIRIVGIQATGFHGVLDREEAHGQSFEVDVVLHLDLSSAAATDDLALTVDYGAVCANVVRRITNDRYLLIETLASRIADDCLSNPAVGSAAITVHKPNAPVPITFADISVTVQRDRPRQDFAYRLALSLGANLGDRVAALDYACTELPRRLSSRLSLVSPTYETAPVGGPEQPDYLNRVLVLGLGEPEEHPTPAQANQILTVCHEVEADLNRKREVRWGPRTLDVDILALGGLEVQDPTLQIPHPRLQDRAFVLIPWVEVDPSFPVPGQGDVAGLLMKLPATATSSVRLFSMP
jgi:dihydroneopterin aldolase/2-amino-4-hydroxy-6-hydroxymethyldihydropteridine diphosphokinase